MKEWRNGGILSWRSVDECRESGGHQNARERESVLLFLDAILIYLL